MRTMHVIGSRYEGGAERFFLRLTRTLAAQGEEVLAVVRPHSVLVDRVDPRVARETVRMRSVVDPFARARIGALARAFGAQVVQTYMGRATRLTHCGGRRQGPVHVARVGRYHELKGLRHAQAWIATTDGIRRYLLDGGLPAARVFRVRNLVIPPTAPDAAALAALRAELGLEPDARVLMCVCRLHRERGVDLLLDAMARLPARAGDAPLRAVVVGDGPQRAALVQQAETLGLGGRVRFVTGPALPEPYLDVADLFVYPARDAPTGTAILEAWNHGVPVIAADTAGPCELIEHGRSGLLVPRDDPDALAGAIAGALAAGGDERAAMVTAAREQLERDHSPPAVARAYLDVYARLLK